MAVRHAFFRRKRRWDFRFRSEPRLYRRTLGYVRFHLASYRWRNFSDRPLAQSCNGFEARVVVIVLPVGADETHGLFVPVIRGHVIALLSNIPCSVAVFERTISRRRRTLNYSPVIRRHRGRIRRIDGRRKKHSVFQQPRLSRLTPLSSPSRG